MQRLPTRLDGLVLLAPTVHGDERGFFMETYRADAWARHGVPTDFVQDNHSRSRRGTLRGIHFQTHPGQGKLVRVRARARARRRRRPAARLADVRRVGGVELDDVARRTSCGSRSASGTASACSREVADFVYKCTELLRRRRPRRASASTIPTSGSSGRGRRAALFASATRRAAAGRDRRLAAVHGVSGTAASHPARPGRCTSATCARRCSRGCSRARRARGSWCGWRTSTRAACGRGRRASSWPTWPRSGSTGTATVVCQSARHGAVRRRRSRGCAPKGACTSASARGRRSARRRRRRTGRCRRAPTRARACG